ncbi:Rhs element Vgr family protein [Yersinia pseudotuberculosis IP 32953]|uniref:Type VI secretion system tip protein VgrG n=5 Tax=Yersinia pseudotuberculosis TaxID=633 RepID=Q66CB3_YERPS|nr:type VI secretion system tip protein VgrG [Yersinia pseudotuberculosis]AJJ53505.1 Rhs element Vgr family protein [Yersinia pseudotuberculosis IP 32953]AJJ71821.1 Rhs element Vgr family protein [Yersinia pseudotuberculosis]PSH12330.1 type IV secretion protein Rhs [Yersinia pseudotuberculosis]PSH25095.1 type IV secretion protein Rhs [Yersinia pseudotuberculosis]PSH30471.1 type IV secretion protein Rhs [Yersinia pseudotuberculosis]
MNTSLPAIRFDHSHHKLVVRDSTAPVDVLGFEGHESLSQPFCYDIQFTSADKAIDPATMLMQDASLTLAAPVAEAFGVTVQQTQRVIHGVVTGFKRLSASKDECRYELSLQPRLALLSRSHQNGIYQDMSVPQIVEKILRERHDMRGQDFVFTLAREYPRREQVMQYGEDDLTFISRLLADVGLWFRFTADPKLNIDVVEFYDDQRFYPPGLTLQAVPPSGMHDSGVESVWDLSSAHQVVEKSVSTGDYNYRTATADMTAGADITRGDTTTYGEAYHYADNYLIAGSEEREPESESGAFYARLRHERYLNNQARFSGVANAATLGPSQELKVTGNDVPAQFGKGVIIIRITSYARRDRSYEVHFEAIPYSEDYCFRPALIRKPTMAGTLPARVTSTTANDTYGHIDKDGRYRVNLMFDRDSWEPGYESLWVRQARPYAGDTYGLHLPLLAGTEVAIAFEDGNPDRPYIAYVLHDSAHGDHVTISNYKRNVLRTPSNNKLRLEDERGKEHIKLSTEYGGKSQLNLGHLVDNEKQPRGEGFELRTDSFGALRAEKGLFISADGQAKAQGQVLEMQPAISLLQGAQEQMDAISADAQTATASPADLQAQISLLQQNLSELKQAVVLLSAPKGIALSSGEHLQMSASENLIATAGKNTDISVAKNLFIGVGNTLSIFVRKLGMKLIANQGPITVQAQNDLMELLARKAITITSTENEIKITAKKRITLNAGGSYITLDENRIESGTAGEYITKAGHYERQEKASLKSIIPAFPIIEPGEHSLRFAFYGDDNVIGSMGHLVGQPYNIRNSAGEVIASGVLDQSGRFPRVKTQEADELTLTLGEEKWTVEELIASTEDPIGEEFSEPDEYDVDSDPYFENIAQEQQSNRLPDTIINKFIGYVEEDI